MAASSPDPTVRAFASFARYASREQVASGGMGSILAATDLAIGRPVAIKVLHERLRGDQEAVQAFYDEARIAGQLDHPNVIPVYDLGSDGEEPFMVMKRVSGETLAQRLGRREVESRNAESDFFELQDHVQTVLKLCDALSFAHEQGVVHCDLKPDNVMVGEHGEVYLMDWGVALRRRRRTQSRTLSEAEEWFQRLGSEEFSERSARGGFRGTPAYMAPEQLLGRLEQVDERTDVFGLGGVLYAILTGDPPNAHLNLLERAIGLEPLPEPKGSRLWKELPPGLCQIALRALAPKREERYASVSELRAELRQFLAGGGWFGTRTYRAGETIVSEGEVADVAFIIESGECDILKRLAGEPQHLRRIGPGGVFGETAVFSPGPRTASVVAATEVTVKIVTSASLNRELDRNPWLAAFVRSLANLFRETDARLSVAPER